MYLMSLKVWNIVVFCCQCTNNCRRKKILFHSRWWVRVALKRKVATGTNINPIHCSTFHVKYLHGIRCANPPWNSMEYPWSIHGVFVEVFYMGYHGGQFPDQMRYLRELNIDQGSHIFAFFLTWNYFEWIIKQLLNLAFVGYEEFCRSWRVLSTLQNSSYPTQPHSIIAKYFSVNNLKIMPLFIYLFIYLFISF